MVSPVKSKLLTILGFEVPADFRVWTAVENPRIAETRPKARKAGLLFTKKKPS
jgi:hypothetical protein